MRRQGRVPRSLLFGAAVQFTVRRRFRLGYFSTAAHIRKVVSLVVRGYKFKGVIWSKSDYS